MITHTCTRAHTQTRAGCWQLSGGHKGDRETDRTAGKEAVADFRAFYDAGITSFDMADHYGAKAQITVASNRRSDARVMGGDVCGSAHATTGHWGGPPWRGDAAPSALQA